MKITLYPDLETASASPTRDAHAVAFGNYFIPSQFIAIFNFSDVTSAWSTILTIAVSDLGNSIIEQLVVTSTYDRKTKERKGVTRKQLKTLEQRRFNLFELALVMGASRFERKITEDGTTYLSMPLDQHAHAEEFLTPSELKKLIKEVDIKIARRKITPEYLQHIADLYTNAVLDGKNPIQTIMESERVAHRTASEYATKARHEIVNGKPLLPATDPGIVTIKKPTTKKGKK